MFYVYVYRDPRPGKGNVPVYVGKGQGARAHAHLSGSSNRRLLRLIADCRLLGCTPKPEIVGRFAAEFDAFALEVALIAKHGRCDLGTGTLYNLTDGGEGAPRVKTTIEDERALLQGIASCVLDVHEARRVVRLAGTKLFQRLLDAECPIIARSLNQRWNRRLPT